MGFKIKNIIPLTIKYSGMNLTKLSQSLCTENYKMPMKEIKDLNKWRDIPSSWIRRSNIIKMPIFPKMIYRFIVGTE